MLSGGFEPPRDLDLKESEDGRALELTIVWPCCMSDLFYLRKAEIYSDSKTYAHQPWVLSFRLYLRSILSKVDQGISCSCSISLPIQVK